MADYQSLEIKVKYARHLKNVNLLSKMDPYVVVSISSDPNTKHKTPVDRTGNKNPTWDSSVKFAVDVAAARRVLPTLAFAILCDRALGDKPIGDVHVPLADLLDSVNGGKACHVAYQVRKPSGRAKGELYFSYQWGEKLAGTQPPATAPPLPAPGKVEEPVAAYPLVAGTSSGFYSPGPAPHGGYGQLYPPVDGYSKPSPAAGKVEETVTAYPVVAGTSSGFYPPVTEPGLYQPATHGGYEHQYPPVVGYSSYPQQSYVGYPPSYQYGGYPPPLGPDYGYQAQPGYGYPPMRPAPRKNNNNNLLGIGAGLLGGLLVGDLLFG